MMEYPEEHRIRREKQRARVLRRSPWWKNMVRSTKCFYCQRPLNEQTATMDHVVPLARGGMSTRGNIVPSCKGCNTRKKSLTVMEWQEYLQGKG